MSPSYSSSLEGSSFDGEILIFNCSHIIFSSYESSFFLFPKCIEGNHFLLAHISHMNESHDPRRPFQVAIIAYAFFTYRFKLFFDLRDPCCMTAWSLHFGFSLPSTIFSKSYSDLCSSLEIAWTRNQTYSVSLGKILVVQVYS